AASRKWESGTQGSIAGCYILAGQLFARAVDEDVDPEAAAHGGRDHSGRWSRELRRATALAPGGSRQAGAGRGKSGAGGSAFPEDRFRARRSSLGKGTEFRSEGVVPIACPEPSRIQQPQPARKAPRA